MIGFHNIEVLKVTVYRFSRWATGCVIVIALSGIWMALSYLPSYSVESLIISAFGRALLLKIFFFSLMIILAFFQRRMIRKFTSKLIKGFISKVRTEFLYGMIVLFFTSILVISTPSASEQGIYPEKQSVDGLELSVDISPLFAGYSEVTLDFGENHNIEDVKVTFTMPPDWKKSNKAFKVSNGTFKLTGMLLHAAGTVNMYVDVTKANGEVVSIPLTVVVPGEYRLNE
jgi:copper transport protein